MSLTQMRPRGAKAAAFRNLGYRYHDPRPRAGDGIAFVEFCIEEQLTRVLDERPADEAVALLGEWNPALNREAVEKLLDLADEVYRREVAGSSDAFYAAVDEYVEALRELALKVRGR